MADETSTETPIGDQVAAEVQPESTPSEVSDEATGVGDTFNAVDGSERPKYGFHDGRFYATFTVAGGDPLDQQQLAACAGNVRLHAVNNGYVAVDNSHDVVTQTSENGKVAQVIVSVPVRDNTVQAAEAAAADAEVPEQSTAGSEG